MHVNTSSSASPATAGAVARGWWGWAGAVVIIALGGCAFAPAMRGTWVWDDHSEVIDNAVIKDPAGIGKIWRGIGTTDYFPLKSTLQWLQWHWWGDSPFPYHVTNVGLHLLGALLVWQLFRKLGLAPVAAWLGGLLFAVHPLGVESVAWIAEFKNAVSLPPLLLAAIWAIDFCERRRSRDYALALVAFVIAALCKTSVVMFPAVLLLYCWWRRSVVTRKDVAAVAPFFAVSAALGAVTMAFQQARAMGTWEIAAGAPLERIGRAGAALVFYLGKTLAPFGLLPVYPRTVPFGSPAAQLAVWFAIIALVFWFWMRRAGWGRHALLASGWFSLNLVPVLGVVPMAFLHFAWVADHFAYIPMIGVIGLAVAGGFRGWQQGNRSRAIVAATAVVVIAFALFSSRRHAAHFVSEESLWRYTLGHNPDAWVGHNNLAVALARQNKFEEALAHATRAQQLKPDYGEAYLNAASYLAQMGRLEEAFGSAARAEQFGARSAEVFGNLGTALLRAGRVPDALAYYQRALDLEPNRARTHKDAGVALYLADRVADAVAHYERGLQTEPDPQTHTNCGVALAALNRLPEALVHYQAALRLAPESVDAHYNLGIALVHLGRLADAQGEFERTVQLRPNHAEAYFHLGEIHLLQQRAPAAAEAFRTALRLRPELAEARTRLQQIEAAGGTP